MPRIRSSGPDLATTISFTNDPIVAGSTPIKAVHLTELRTAVNAVRAAAGQAPASFANPVAPGSPIRAIDVTELRANLDGARATLGLPVLPYTDAALGPGATGQGRSRAGAAARRQVAAKALTESKRPPPIHHLPACGSLRMHDFLVLPARRYPRLGLLQGHAAGGRVDATRG